MASRVSELLAGLRLRDPPASGRRGDPVASRLKDPDDLHVIIAVHRISGSDRRNRSPHALDQ